MAHFKVGIKYWIYSFLCLIFAIATLVINHATYFGLLSLLPGFIALLFGWASLKHTNKIQNLINFSRAGIIVAILACSAVIIGELSTKKKEKIKSIDEFSRQIDNNFEVSDSTSGN